MKPRPPLARLATDLLAAEEAPPREVSREAEAEAIARTARAIVEAARARRRRRLAATAAVLVAAAVAVLVVRSTPATTPAPLAATPALPAAAPAPAKDAALGQDREIRMQAATAVTLIRQGAEQSTTTATLRTSDRVVAGRDVQVDVSVSTGTRLVLEPNAEVTVVEQTALQMYSLHRGALQADVAKLAVGERFVVHTPDADIEVRGTRFRIEIAEPDPDCGGGTRTRLSVREGHVVVKTDRTEAHVLGGEVWPRGCRTPGHKTEKTDKTDKTTESTKGAAGTESKRGAPPASGDGAKPLAARSFPSEAASDLAAQNSLLAEAAAARKKGNSAEAIAIYDRFLARHPSSALAETAHAERMRLLAKTDRAGATAAAREYLARFPQGYARSEAAALVAAAP